MFTCRILRLSFYARYYSANDLCITKTKNNNNNESNATKKKQKRNFSSNALKTQQRQSFLRYVIAKWTLAVGFGFAISIYAFSKAIFFRRERREDEPVNDIVIDCYRYLPLRITSRIWGWIASIQLPTGLRPKIYGLYAKTFSANLEEINEDLSAFPSLVDFFVRPLKPDARPICNDTNIVSPADGKVLYFGPVTSCNVVQVKGVTYNLRHFLGDIDWPQTENKEVCTDYISTLLKNPKNCLYQLTVYLAPGDYHRFHSPTDWLINFRRHFQGKLLSVNPKVASWLPNLFSLNERVVYIGEWAAGFMAYAAIGATNVGSIRVFCDDQLVTNARKWPKGKLSEDADMGRTEVKKGDLFGEFRMGSTIVMLFEAPKDFQQFCVESGCKIQVGQPLAKEFVTCK